MTARVVPLGSAEADRPPSPRTAKERIELVAVVSRQAWSLTGRRLPEYTRAEMPVTVSTLTEQGHS
ncbi:MAG: hypothetical protein R3324_18420 [Halobacteriales archaeon]|nr:hypothetical protein [Halobacteriales archaeon]